MVMRCVAAVSGDQYVGVGWWVARRDRKGPSGTDVYHHMFVAATIGHA